MVIEKVQGSSSIELEKNFEYIEEIGYLIILHFPRNLNYSSSVEIARIEVGNEKLLY